MALSEGAAELAALMMYSCETFGSLQTRRGLVDEVVRGGIGYFWIRRLQSGWVVEKGGSVGKRRNVNSSFPFRLNGTNMFLSYLFYS